MKLHKPEWFETCHDFSTGEGWEQLLTTLVKTLMWWDNAYGDTRTLPDFRVVQVKEKFGGLRFYTEGGDNFTAGAIALAEAMSFNICERCGHPGEISTKPTGWALTLCPEHTREREEAQNAG